MNTRIDQTSRVSTQNVQRTDVVEQKKVGAGATGQSGAVPPAAESAGDVMPALRNFSPGVIADLETKLAEVATKMRENRGETELQRVNSDQQMKQQQIEENQAKMKEATEKMGKADDARGDAEVSNIIGTVFQILGAILMAVIGAALMAVPGLQGAGVLMMVGAAFLAASGINGIVAASTDTGMGIAGSLALAFGADEETAAGIDMGVTIGLAVISAAYSIAASIATGGATAASAVAAIASVASAINGAASGAAQVATSVSGLVAASYNKEAVDLRADTKESQAVMQQMDDYIDQTLSKLMASNEQFNSLIDDITSMAKETGDMLSNVRFAG